MRTIFYDKLYVLVALWADGTETILTEPTSDYTALFDAAVKFQKAGIFDVDDSTEIREVA